MKKILIAVLLIAMSSLTYAQNDRDINNDGQWDVDRGGTDSDLDNDGQWDSGRGGTDRDIDNYGQWDSNRGGTDRDLNNDDQWDSSRAAPIEFSITMVGGIPTMMVQIGI
jgi:Ni/Co efflux regulator RcnB